METFIEEHVVSIIYRNVHRRTCSIYYIETFIEEHIVSII